MFFNWQLIKKAMKSVDDDLGIQKYDRKMQVIVSCVFSFLMLIVAISLISPELMMAIFAFTLASILLVALVKCFWGATKYIHRIYSEYKMIYINEGYEKNDN